MRSLQVTAPDAQVSRCCSSSRSTPKELRQRESRLFKGQKCPPALCLRTPRVTDLTGDSVRKERDLFFVPSPPPSMYLLTVIVKLNQ
eukprot:jgi/Botrbrau1/11174/Bobra.182_2s0027.1